MFLNYFFKLVFIKERTNRWYSCLAYYTGRTLADVPFRIFFPVIYSLIVYKMTGQVDDNYRLFLFCAVNVTFAFLAHAKGTLFGCIFVNSIAAASVNACVSLVPFLLVAGFLVTVNRMPYIFSVSSSFSYCRVSILIIKTKS